MKTVFKSSELPHIFFHQRAPLGRCSSAMSFDGGIFYSYRAPIAALHAAPTGELVAFLNRSRYSNTTSGHQSAVWRAATGQVKCFLVDHDSINSPESMVSRSLEVATNAIGEADSIRSTHPRRKKDIAASENKAATHLQTALDVAQLFNLPHLIAGVAGLDTLLERARLAAMERERMALEHKARVEERERKEREEFPAKLAEWRTGERVHFPHDGSDGKTYFRLRGDTLQSSKGVDITIEETRSALAFILSKRGTGWRKNGERYPVAGYELDSICEAGIIAGCHRFDWAEVEYVRSLV
jgi:hypothetical protein